MTSINQFAISKVLGSKVKPMGRVEFGNFQLRPTTEEIQKAFQDNQEASAPAAFSYQEDSLVVQAFERVRNGSPTDELLWNRTLAAEFVKECKSLGLNAPDAYLIRRLINVRKNAPRYKEHGIEIKPTQKKEVHPSIVAEFAHVIEFALVKLRYRYGVSIDDVLMDPVLVDKFEAMAREIAPGLSSSNLRLGALYIRKNRVLKKKELDTIRKLDTAAVKRAWEKTSVLTMVDVAKVPDSPGLIELSEPKRCLYISHNKDIHAAIEQLHTGQPFRLIANHFWKPNLDEITLRYVHGLKIAGVSIETWERRLVYDLEPVFNWPMAKKVA
jgi:hypothetical protein